MAVSTSRKKGKNKGKPQAARVRKGGRVKVTRKTIYHVLLDDMQKGMLENVRDNYNLYGTVLSGKANTGYNVSFDIFPAGHKEVFLLRKKVKPLLKGEEEPEYDRARDDPCNLQTEEELNRNRERPMVESTNAFVAQDRATLQEATVYDMKWGEGEDDVVKWKILGDTEHIQPEDDRMAEWPEQVTLKKEIEFDHSPDGNNLAHHFFESFFRLSRVMQRRWIASTLTPGPNATRQF